MYEGHVIGVVVPAYNESGQIGNVIRSMPSFVDSIYIIDDASTDGTWVEILDTAREEDATLDQSAEIPTSTIADGGFDPLIPDAEIHPRIGRVVPIKHHSNRGAGGAIKTGYLAARQDNIDIAVTMDGDGQMEPSFMSKLLEPIVEGRADYAKGNRLVYREYREEMPRFRYVGNAILTFLTKIASGYWKTMDPQNGYTAISKHALENVGVEAMFEYYGYCNDLLVKMNAKGMRVADVPIPAVYGEEESSIKYPTYIRKVSLMLFQDFVWRLRTRYLVLDFHPLALFYFVGAITTIGAIGAGIWSIYSVAVMGESLFVRGILSLILFLIGCLFLMFAMLFDMQVNEGREVQIHD